jgi:hypothetical protein
MQIDIIKELIADVVKREEEELSALNKGIFFCPERAIVYLIGKRISQHRDRIFENPNEITWDMERVLGNKGPSDLVFLKGNTPLLVMEFKIDETYEKYVNDIVKLHTLKMYQPSKVFCALIDAFERDGESDIRIQRTEELAKKNGIGIKRIKPWPTFRTKHWCKSQVICIIAMWEVDNPAEQINPVDGK